MRIEKNVQFGIGTTLHYIFCVYNFYYFFWIVKFEWIMGVRLWLWQKELLLFFKCRRGWGIIALCSQLIEWNNQRFKLSIVRVSSVESIFFFLIRTQNHENIFNKIHMSTPTEYTNQCMHNILCKCLFDFANDLYIKPKLNWKILI